MLEIVVKRDKENEMFTIFSSSSKSVPIALSLTKENSIFNQ